MQASIYPGLTTLSSNSLHYLIVLHIPYRSPRSQRQGGMMLLYVAQTVAMECHQVAADALFDPGGAVSCSPLLQQSDKTASGASARNVKGRSCREPHIEYACRIDRAHAKHARPLAQHSTTQVPGPGRRAKTHFQRASRPAVTPVSRSDSCHGPCCIVDCSFARCVEVSRRRAHGAHFYLASPECVMSMCLLQSLPHPWLPSLSLCAKLCPWVPTSAP